MENLFLSSVYGLGVLMKMILKILGKDIPVPTPVGLDRGEKSWSNHTALYYRNMEEAVFALIDHKYLEKSGIFRNGRSN